MTYRESSSFISAQRRYDNMTPPDDPRCPICGGPIESTRFESSCLAEDCGWSFSAHEECDERYDEWRDEH